MPTKLFSSWRCPPRHACTCTYDLLCNLACTRLALRLARTFAIDKARSLWCLVTIRGHFVLRTHLELRAKGGTIRVRYIVYEMETEPFRETYSYTFSGLYMHESSIPPNYLGETLDQTLIVCSCVDNYMGLHFYLWLWMRSKKWFPQLDWLRNKFMKWIPSSKVCGC